MLIVPLVVAVVVLLALGALLSYACVHPSSQLLGKTIVRGDGALPVIALTFDDGPGEATPQILDILKGSHIRATFFLCGQNVERFPDYARRIAAEGHEIANHTYSHPRFFWKMPGSMALEITKAQGIIEKASGSSPMLFRPPYGIRWFGLSSTLSTLCLTPVMWSVSGVDWRWPASRIAERVIRRARPGDIVLLHDGVPMSEQGDRRETVQALSEIVRVLGERYRFVPVSEMVQPSGSGIK